MAKNTYKSKSGKKKKKAFRIDLDFLSDRRFQTVSGFTLLGISLFLLIAFISYLFTGKADQSIITTLGDVGVNSAGGEVENWLGLLGAYLSHFFIFRSFGVASFLIPPLLFLIGYKVIFYKEIIPIARTSYFVLFFLFWISILTGNLLFSSEEVSEWGFISGGVGYEVAILLNSILGWGTFLLLGLLFLSFIVYFFNVTIPFPGLNESSASDEQEEQEAVGGIVIDDSGNNEAEPVSTEDEERIEKVLREIELDAGEPKKEKTEESNNDLELEIGEESKAEIIEEAITEPSEEPSEDIDLEVIDEKPEEEKSDELENYDPTLDLGKYQYPTVDLLSEYPNEKVQVTKDELELNKDKIIETLINFKIGISSIKATIGPTVTLYEIVPEAGVKISKIKNLEDDIALSLAALGIRIIAPIPGKGTIGIEVPNKNRELVSMRSVVTTEKFMKSEMALPVILGKTISNEVYMTDLAKMPHLLMAGATGQGKSVGLNVMLTSLIYKKHPSQLKFVLVDPKKVELTLFNTIERHFLAKLPDSEEAIITDTKKVVYTLNSLCIEMDQRYDLMKEAACRNIKEYNEKFVNRKLNPNKGHKFMPYIVLVIDELADLMMTAGKEVEGPIARLAQLARAIGIHLVIATQRPSVNVITGVIKANFPARLSFRVTSKIDSRTILDTGGAEQLVGWVICYFRVVQTSLDYNALLWIHRR